VRRMTGKTWWRNTVKLIQWYNGNVTTRLCRTSNTSPEGGYDSPGQCGNATSRTTRGVSLLTVPTALVAVPPAFRGVNAAPDYTRRHGGKFSLTTATTLTKARGTHRGVGQAAVGETRRRQPYSSLASGVNVPFTLNVDAVCVGWLMIAAEFCSCTTSYGERLQTSASVIYLYHSWMQRSVASVCPVCPVRALTFENLDLET